MSTPTVLILGANGRFGRAATEAFATAGWRVLAQLRRPPSASLPRGAVAITAALAGPAALAAAAAGASVVVHGINPVYTRWDIEALPALRQGVAAAEALGALFMLPGNVYNFGSTMPALLQPDTPQQPDTRKGEIRCAMEALMRARAQAGALRSVVIRAGDFFGGGVGSWFDQAIVKDLAWGKLVYPGPQHLAHAWAYLPDLARAFVAVATGLSAVPAAEYVNLHFEGHTLTGDQLLGAIDTAASHLGLRPAGGFRVGGLPWSVIRAVGLVHAPWRELARMSDLWRVPHALDGRALEAVAGPLPATPLVDAVAQSLRGLGLQPRPGAAALAA